jgi:hypothetical protein
MPLLAVFQLYHDNQFLVVEEAEVPGETIIYASVFTVKFNK